MTNAYITVLEDSSGTKKMQTYENNVGGVNVHAEAVALVDSNGAPNPTIPVSGTFWQAIQPVNGIVTANQSNASNFLATVSQGSGAWYLSAINTAVTVISPNASNFLATVAGTVAATQSGTWNVGTLTSVTNPVTVAQSNASNFNATVSGTVTANANIAQIAGTTADTNSGNKSAGTLRVVLATDQPALTSKLLVTPDANSAFNLSQILGTTVDGNSGNKSGGTLRVVLATDQPQLTSKLLVTPDTNTSFNLGMVGGVATSTSAAGVQKCGIVGATGSALDGTTAGVIDQNLKQVGGQTTVASVTGVQDVMPRKRDATTGLSPVYYVGRITTKTTTSVTASTAYVSVIKAATSNAGTGATMNFNDIFGTGNRTLAAVNFPGGNMTTGHYLESYTEPIKFTNGIQIITGGTTMGDCNVAITYWQ